MAIVAVDSIAEPHSLDQQKFVSCSIVVMLYAKDESFGTTRTRVECSR